MTFPRKPGSNELDIDAFFRLSEELQKTALIDLYDTGSDTEVQLVELRIQQVTDQLPEDQIRQLQKLEELRQREIVLDKQAQQSMLLFQANMLKTLDGVKKDDGKLLTTEEKIALNKELTTIAVEQLVGMEPKKTEAQLKKEEEKRLVAEMRAKIEISDQMHSENSQLTTQSTSHSTTNHRTSKNRGCTLF